MDLEAIIAKIEAFFAKASGSFEAILAFIQKIANIFSAIAPLIAVGVSAVKAADLPAPVSA
jgi:hypothetical protein